MDTVLETVKNVGSMAATAGLAAGEVSLDLACSYGAALLALGLIGHTAYQIFKWY